MTNFLILPNQLFDYKLLDKKNKFIIWEHPHYFKNYNYNKKKLILHRASMKYYYEYLKKKKIQCEYYEFNKKPKINNYLLFDPIDEIDLPGDYEIIENPNFLLNKEIYEKYRKKTKKFFFNAFYMWSKKELDILPNIKSQDKDNRKSIPKNIKIPGIPNNSKDQKYINEAITYVNKNFKDNYGNTENFIFPISHSTAKKFITYFIKYKLDNFGNYQDAIIKEEQFLFHRRLTRSGLNPPADEIAQASLRLVYRSLEWPTTFLKIKRC